MTPTAYTARLLALVLLVCGGLAAVSLSMEPLQGDLTRIGMYLEKDYGYSAPQTRFSPSLFESSKEEPRDILVLGDSYSNDHAAAWENYLARDTGMSLMTYTHGSSPGYRALLDLPAFRANPPKVFIYQIVERSLLLKLGYSGVSCPAEPIRVPRLDRPARARPAAAQSYDRPRRRRLSEINLAYAGRYLGVRFLRALKPDWGHVRRFALDRKAFSSVQGSSLLVFDEDLGKGQWSEAAIQNIRCSLLDMQRSVQRGGRTIFMALLIPDKLTAYRSLLRDKREAPPSPLGRLAEDLNAPRVDLALAAAIEAGVKDVYLPDDTHLGSAGYAIVAREVERALGVGGRLKPADEGKHLP